MKYLKIILKTFHALIYLIYTSCIPKDKNLWVFGAWKGRSYSDNSKELFEYVCREHPEINAIWIAKNEKIYNEVKKTGNKVVLYPSKEAKRLVARAGVNIQTESNEDTGRFRVGGTKIIQLFHGYGAVKEAHMYAGMSNLKKRIVKIYADDHSKSNWMVPSEYFVKRCSELFELDPQKAYITGQPRIDCLLRYENNEYLEGFIKANACKKLILYMPTHRNYGQQKKVPFSEKEWMELNEFLTINEYYLFFKPHPLEVEFYNGKDFAYSNIILIDNKSELEDPYEYIHYFDLLISDYSSIAADYLVLDRPIIYFMYDLKTFETKDYKLDALNKFVAGPICYDWREVMDTIQGIGNCDHYHEIRMEVRNLVMKYADSNNCERVYNTICSILYDEGRNFK